MSSVKSLEKRYDIALRNEDYYSAEQALRMLHHRLTTSSPSQPEEALEKLFTGAETMFSHAQLATGSSVALLIVKHLTTRSVPVREDLILRLHAVGEKYELCSPMASISDTRREKLRFLEACIAWTSRRDCGGYEHGSGKLNADAGYTIGALGDFDAAVRHFVRSDCGGEAGTFLYEFTMTKVLDSEKGLVLTKTILHYLLTDNLRDGWSVLGAFYEKTGWKKVGAGAENSGKAELGNFCEILMKLCEVGEAGKGVYERAVKAYEIELKRDEQTWDMVRKVGEKYLGVRSMGNAGMGGMMNMLQGLMGRG